jgi:hypothetical protein
MKYYIEESLDNFEAWSGGKDTLDVLIENGDCDAVECLIEELYCDDAPSQTAINDFLWFERDTIAEHLGYDSWDEYENRDDNDEEDE